MSVQKALILVGSPKPSGGTSGAIADHLTLRLKKLNVAAEMMNVHRLIDEGKEDEIIQAIERNEAVVLTFPLYFDSLPSGVVRFFELFLEKKGKDGGAGKPFYAVSNSGVPESIQSTVALEICVIFARDTGFVWKGGAAFGAGESLDGKDIVETGKVVKNLSAGLGLLAVSVSQGGGLSKHARNLIGRPIAAKFLYMMRANRKWKEVCRENGTYEKLRDRPFDPK